MAVCLISVIDYTALHAHIQDDGTNCTSLANQIAVQWRQHLVAKSEEKPAVSAQGEVWFTLPKTELAALLPCSCAFDFPAFFRWWLSFNCLGSPTIFYSPCLGHPIPLLAGARVRHDSIFLEGDGEERVILLSFRVFPKFCMVSCMLFCLVLCLQGMLATFVPRPSHPCVCRLQCKRQTLG